MGFLFKSAAERAREARRAQRKAFREAENVIEAVKDRVTSMNREATRHWEEARSALKEGQQAAAQRALTSYRAAQVLSTKLEQKRWVFEQYLTKMQVAQSDNQFASALGAINKVVRIDPENVADVFESAQDILGEQLDADRFWSKLYGKEMEGATENLEDYIPNMTELEQQLEQEVAAEVGGNAAPIAASDAIDSRIASGQERVKKLLEGK